MPGAKLAISTWKLSETRTQVAHQGVIGA